MTMKKFFMVLDEKCALPTRRTAAIDRGCDMRSISQPARAGCDTGIAASALWLRYDTVSRLQIRAAMTISQPRRHGCDPHRRIAATTPWLRWGDGRIAATVSWLRSGLKNRSQDVVAAIEGAG